MDQLNLASGDNNDLITSTDNNEVQSKNLLDGQVAENSTSFETSAEKDYNDNNDTTLKERIAQCKEILTSLKLELSEEKRKIFKEGRVMQSQSLEDSCIDCAPKLSYIDDDKNKMIPQFNDLPVTTDTFTSSFDYKLHCDENLLEYEKQLQKYQKTLNMAQIEKKNAIRKQMLAKAFKLKLLEIENQCNIELIRIKQSLQCLEPLKVIVEKWKTNNNDNSFDTFELIPRYPEFATSSGSDTSSISNVDNVNCKFPT